ncbi:MAG: prephenate dehydrogenase/arogenate dehydrogenase family protein [Pseudomonadota bacterium]
MFDQLGLIGCGLMGGSFALALRRAGLVKRIVGYSQSASTTEQAQQLGVIDATAPSALHAVSGADLVLVAVPVAASEITFAAIRPGISAETLVMDVGSTKSDVIAAARRGLQAQFGSFVPAHPIAGKERSGVEHADAALYAGRHVVLTPVETTRLVNIQRAATLWSAIGAQVLTMTPEAHDSTFAAVSHLPHLLAFAFVNGIASQPEGQRFLELAGPGFRDFTRIAAADPTMWHDVLLANREQVLLQAKAFRHALDALEATLRDGDSAALKNAIASASSMRSQWTMGSGSSLG